MHLNPRTGLWEQDDNDYMPVSVAEEPAEDDSEEKEAPKKEKKMVGTCVLSIQFQNHGEYLRWKQVAGGGRQWEFLVSYPATMRSECKFTNALEVEMTVKKIVQMLENGIDVYSAAWKLEEVKEDETD